MAWNWGARRVLIATEANAPTVPSNGTTAQEMGDQLRIQSVESRRPHRGVRFTRAAAHIPKLAGHRTVVL
jgi:hypothetical protein